MSSTTAKGNIAQLQSALKENNVSFYIIPSADRHIGEALPDHWRMIVWLTGFTGSAATVVVTQSFAGLWTDSRYFIQAEKQLADSGCILMHPDNPGYLGFKEWIGKNSKDSDKIAFDGRIFSLESFRKLKNSVAGKNVSLDTEYDLISGLWKNRPALPKSTAFEHPVKYSGKQSTTKIDEVRNNMKERGVDYHLLTAPEDVMWLFNIRGGDIKYTPVILSFAIIGLNEIFLFIDKDKLSESIATDLNRMDVITDNYEKIQNKLSSLPAGSSVLLTPETTSVSLFNSIPENTTIIEDISIPARLKSVKNSVEIENIRNVMVRDGVALTRFLYFIDAEMIPGRESEISLVEKIDQLRSEQENHIEPSFATIVAYNEHSALPHYSPSEETDSTIDNGILLIDSGGQYLDGTTDITRTVAIGSPNSLMKKDFTLVLKGMIDLTLAKFPVGTNGSRLDAIARKPLWDEGLNFGHGTGHGVGFCLNVHEGPYRISPLSVREIIPGLVLSNEPGVYKEGEYGIRIENLVLTVEGEKTQFGQFLKLETLSLCYIDRSLIEMSLLDEVEVAWLNSYHENVYQKLSPFLSDSVNGWLADKTKPL